MKVLRGIWVAYEKPDFTGHQYLLEEENTGAGMTGEVTVVNFSLYDPY